MTHMNTTHKKYISSTGYINYKTKKRNKIYIRKQKRKGISEIENMGHNTGQRVVLDP